MMICEPSFNPVQMRETLVEMAFEKYMCPAVFLGRNAVLSSFATGRQTSMMIDSGHKGTTGSMPISFSWLPEVVEIA